MKKILLLFIISFIFCQTAFADDNLSFIYINGSNNNDPKMVSWYEKGVKKLHPALRKKFLKNSAIKKYYKQNGTLTIKEEPVIFFWGYDSKRDLDFVKNKLEISKAVSSSGAYLVRSLITKYLHDAIWVQKPQHMIPVLEDLNDTVKKETAQGNKVILFGYSAGTFVTYEYFFNKLRYINLEELFKALNADEEMMTFVKNNPQKNTCLSAITEKYGALGTISQTGHLIINPDKEMLKQNYLKMNYATEKACAPEGMIKGIVNFASPLPLFYSDLGDEEYELSYYNLYMLKYILENGIFMITANFREDPLGFPTSRNLTIDEIEKILDINIENPSGVLYDNSTIWSKRMFPFAHTSYWSAKRVFSSNVVKSFVNGYKFQYDKKYQDKVLKRKHKNSEL